MDYKLLGRNDVSNISTSTTVIVILSIQTLLILVVYPFIIGTIVIRFQEDVGELEVMIQEMSDPQIGRSHQTRIQPENPADANGNVMRCKGCERGANVDQRDGGHSLKHRGHLHTGVVEWCASDQQLLKKMILKLIWEERSQRDYQSQGITLGAVERLVESMVNVNRTQTRMLSPMILPVAVHLTSGPEGFFANTEIPNERGKVKVGPWESLYGEAFSLHVGVDGFSIIIPKTGIYYLYSQAYFRDEREGESREEAQITEYLHYTVLENTAYSDQAVDLMKSGRTKAGQDNAEYYYSSFHAGMFKLREGDKIYMKVYLASEQVKIDCRQESTFMGLYLVSSD